MISKVYGEKNNTQARIRLVVGRAIPQLCSVLERQNEQTRDPHHLSLMQDASRYREGNFGRN